MQKIFSKGEFEGVKWEAGVVDQSVAGDEVISLPSHHGDEVVCRHLGGDVHAGVLTPVQQGLDKGRLPSGVLAHRQQDGLGVDIGLTDGRIPQDTEQRLPLQRQKVFVVSME